MLGGDEVDEGEAVLGRRVIEADEVFGHRSDEVSGVAEEVEELAGPEGGLKGYAAMGGVFGEDVGEGLGLEVLVQEVEVVSLFVGGPALWPGRA